MDDADRAAERDEIMDRARLAAVKTTPEALATGACLTCDEPVPAPHRWCGVDCRNQWDHVKRRGRK